MLRGQRKRLPDIRESLTARGQVATTKFYVTVGFYPDDPTAPGEVFIHIAKNGSTLGGLCASLALTLSLGLQHGATWEDLSAHLRYTKFEPADHTFSSLVHAIAVTVDRLIEFQREFYSRSLNVPLDATPTQSSDEPSPPTPDPTRAVGE